LPILGDALQTLALAKFTWALQMVFDTPMDLRKALPLALDASGTKHFSKLGPEVQSRIERGQSITQALAATGKFPPELLDSIAVGEESGSLVETMKRQADEYEERATMAISVLAQVASYGIWLLVVAFLVLMIFRIFSTYLNTINS